MKIINTELNNNHINRIVEFGYQKEGRKGISILSGRLVDFNEEILLLDVSEDYVSMELVEFKVERIFSYFRICPNENMWR